MYNQCIIKVFNSIQLFDLQTRPKEVKQKRQATRRVSKTKKSVKEKCSVTLFSKASTATLVEPHSEMGLHNKDVKTEDMYIKSEPEDYDEMKPTGEKITKDFSVNKAKCKKGDSVVTEQTGKMCDSDSSESDHTTDLSGNSDTNINSCESEYSEDTKRKKRKETLKRTYKARRSGKSPEENSSIECTSMQKLSEHSELKRRDFKPQIKHTDRSCEKRPMKKCPVENCHFETRGKRTLEGHLDALHSGAKPFSCSEPGILSIFLVSIYCTI